MGLGQCFVAGTQVVVRVAPDGTVSADTPSNDYFLGNAVLAASLVVIAVQGRRRILNARRRDERDEELDEAFATWNGDGPDAEVDEDPSARGMAMSVAVAVQSPQPNIDQTQPLAIAASETQAAVSPAAVATTARPGIAPKARGSRLRMRPVLALTWLCAFLSLAGWFGYRALPDNVTASAFAHETPVTPAKPRYITKNIEDVREGETVMAMDPATGRLRPKAVLHTFVRTANHLQLVTIEDSAGQSQTLQTTDEHPFWSADRKAWIVAEDLHPDERVLGPSGELQQIRDNRREEHPEGVTVYNFEVDDFHSYFVAGEVENLPLLVHNASKQYSESNRPSYRVAHDLYKRAVLATRHWAERAFHPEGLSARGRGTRRFDGWDNGTRTGFEANLTPWSQMTLYQLTRKLEQVAKDLQLLRNANGPVRRIIWFGSEALPTTGWRGQLAEALREANIPYYVINP